MTELLLIIGILGSLYLTRLVWKPSTPTQDIIVRIAFHAEKFNIAMASLSQAFKETNTAIYEFSEALKEAEVRELQRTHEEEAS